MESFGPEILKLVEIVWINIILSGDNAVVIAMACHGLPPSKQRAGMVLGALVAIAPDRLHPACCNSTLDSVP
jgi:predicted tellurium resistance membrane protein TerC